MRRQTVLTLGIDTNKVFEKEIQLSAFRSLADFNGHRKLFINLNRRTDRDRWIGALRESLKPMCNMRRAQAIQRRYNRTTNNYAPRKTFLSQSTIIRGKNDLREPAIRRRSCVCEECGHCGKKMSSLDQKAPRSSIQQLKLLSKAKKQTVKGKSSMKRLASKVDQRVFTMSTITMRTKFGEIPMLPSSIDTYMQLAQKFRLRTVKGSKDDLELKTRTSVEEFQERKSVSQLDKILKDLQEKEAAALKKQVHYTEETDSDDLSKSPSIDKRSMRKVPSSLPQTIKSQVELQKQKKEIVMKNVLQRNRLTANETINKFLVRASTARDSNHTGSWTMKSVQKKAFQCISLHSMHSQSQKLLKTEAIRSEGREKINSAMSSHINRLRTMIRTQTSQSSRKKYPTGGDEVRQDCVFESQFSNRPTISQSSGRSKLAEIYKQFATRNTPNSQQKNRRQK